MSTSQRHLSAINAPLSVHEIQHPGMLPRPVTSLRQTTGSLKGTGSTPVARTEALWSEPTPFRPSSEFHQVSFSPPLRSFTLATVATDNDWSQPERDRSMTSPASSRRSSVTTHVTTDLDEGKIYSLVVIESTPTSTSHAKQASPPSPRSPLASTQSVTGQSSTMDLERMTDSTGILGTSHLEDGYESSHSYLSHRSPPSLSEAGASYRSAPSESAGSPSSQESAVSPLSADSKGHEDRLVPDGPGLRADAKDVPDDDPLELPDWLARSIPTLTILAQVAQASSLSNKGHHQHYHHHPRFPQHPSYGYGPRYKVEHRSTSWDQHQQQQSSSVRINVESTSFPFLKGPAHAPHHSVPPRDEFAYYRDPLPEAHVSRYAYRGSESDVKAELQTADDRRADDPRMPYPKPPPPPPPSYADATSQEMYRRRASAGGLNRRPSYGTLIHRDRSATSPYPSMSNSASAGSRQSKGEYSRARTQVHLHPNDTVRLKPFPDFDSGRPRDLSQAALKPGSRCVVSTSGDAKRLAFKPASQPQQPAGQIGLTTVSLQHVIGGDCASQIDGSSIR